MSTFDDNNPGLVNVADQAYPAVPPTSQGLPVPFEFNPSLVAPPPLPTFSAGGPTPVDAFVANVGGIPAPFSLGTPLPALKFVDISVQDLIKFPTADWVVTATGNFQTNNAAGIPVEFPHPRRRRHRLGLADAGLSNHPSEPRQPQRVRPRPDGHARVVPGCRARERPRERSAAAHRLVRHQLVPGRGVRLRGEPAHDPRVRQRHPDQHRPGRPRRHQPDQPPSHQRRRGVAPATAAARPRRPQFNFTGNFSAHEEVRGPFVGSGVATPPNIGTFEVENQSLVGQGLPANVFV